LQYQQDQEQGAEAIGHASNDQSCNDKAIERILKNWEILKSINESTNVSNHKLKLPAQIKLQQALGRSKRFEKNKSIAIE